MFVGSSNVSSRISRDTGVPSSDVVYVMSLFLAVDSEFMKTHDLDAESQFPVPRYIHGHEILEQILGHLGGILEPWLHDVG
ncbi:hypothetical protein AHF37_01766 [Paragonimus kellicotti]|nr:hypothetical protein AHF37_01766 [Paragonimus kellicotti]